MKIDYMENLTKVFIACNRKAWLYGDIQAMVNKRRKNVQKCLPRGKVYWRLKNLQGRKQLDELASVGRRFVEYVNMLESTANPE